MGIELPAQSCQAHDDLSARDLGDLVLGVEYLQRWTTNNAATSSRSFELSGAHAEVTWQQRLPVIIAHGLAHLLGHTHEDDTDHAQMQACEQELLRFALSSAQTDRIGDAESCSDAHDTTDTRTVATHSSVPLLSSRERCRADCAQRAVEVGACCAVCLSALQRLPHRL